MDIFRTINLRRLFLELKQDDWMPLEDKLKYSHAFWRTGFSPEEEILGLCRAGLAEDEFERLRKQLWKGTLAYAGYDILRCDGAPNGMFPARVEPAVDFSLFYLALKQIFERAKDLALARKLPVFAAIG